LEVITYLKQAKAFQSSPIE